MRKTRQILLRIVLISLVVVLLTLSCGAIAAYARYRALEDTGLPRLDVFTQNEQPIESKTEYVGCRVSLQNVALEYAMEDVEAKIRGRGNDTWSYYPKKPYRLKFEEKTSLFGETEQKSWVLLALYNDFSRMKDRLGFMLADSLDRGEFVPCYHYVDLHVNGSYQGLYLLTDRIDENAGRTDIEASITAGMEETPFLVELDARAPEEGTEGVDWFSVYGMTYAVRYPNAQERASAEQFSYIREYIQAVDTLCRTEGVTMDALSQYVDVESLAAFYLVQELMGQPEINWKSVYMYKTAEGKLKMGPVWDFDWAAMGPSTGKYKDSYRDLTEGFRSSGNWFDALYHGSEEFRALLKEMWQDAREGFSETLDRAEADRAQITRAAERDHLRWHWYRIGSSYELYSENVIAWCRARMAWLDRVLL